MLPETHRRAQLAIRNEAIRDLTRLFPSLDFNRISDSWEPLEAALLLLIRKRGRLSSGLASRFYRDIRKEQDVAGIATPIAASPDEEVMIRGLRVVGPANAALQLAKRIPLDLVRKRTFVNLAGETTRLVGEHGRMTLTESLVADKEANGTQVGVERITSGSPCAWCAQQASETYPPTERFPAHMHCSCYPSPVFT